MMYGLLAVILFRAVAIIAASFQDALDVRALKRIATLPKPKGRTPKQVTQFIVIAYNQQDTIVATLDSIANCKPVLPVLVLDNASKDNTLSFARKYAKTTGNKITISTSYKRQHTSNTLLVKQLAKKARGTHLIVLSGNSIITPKSVTSIAKALKKSPTLSMLSFRQKAAPSLHYFGILETILRSYYRTTTPLTELGFIAQKTDLLVPQAPAAFATNTFINTTPVSSTNEFVNFVKTRTTSLPLYVKILSLLDQLLLLGITGYALVLAFTYTSAQLLFFILGVTLLWLLYGIISSTTQSYKQKVQATFFAPTLLVLLPFYSLLRVFYLITS